MYFYLFHTQLSALLEQKNKIKLAFIVVGSCASDVFSQVMSLAKLLNVPSHGVGQVTG